MKNSEETSMNEVTIIGPDGERMKAEASFPIFRLQKLPAPDLSFPGSYSRAVYSRIEDCGSPDKLRKITVTVDTTREGEIRYEIDFDYEYELVVQASGDPDNHWLLGLGEFACTKEQFADIINEAWKTQATFPLFRYNKLSDGQGDDGGYFCINRTKDGGLKCMYIFVYTKERKTEYSIDIKDYKFDHSDRDYVLGLGKYALTEEHFREIYKKAKQSQKHFDETDDILSEFYDDDTKTRGYEFKKHFDFLSNIILAGEVENILIRNGFPLTSKSSVIVRGRLASYVFHPGYTGRPWLSCSPIALKEADGSSSVHPVDELYVRNIPDLVNISFDDIMSKTPPDEDGKEQAGKHDYCNPTSCNLTHTELKARGEEYLSRLDRDVYEDARAALDSVCEFFKHEFKSQPTMSMSVLKKVKRLLDDLEDTCRIGEPVWFYGSVRRVSAELIGKKHIVSVHHGWRGLGRFSYPEGNGLEKLKKVVDLMIRSKRLIGDRDVTQSYCSLSPDAIQAVENIAGFVLRSGDDGCRAVLAVNRLFSKKTAEIMEVFANGFKETGLLSVIAKGRDHDYRGVGQSSLLGLGINDMSFSTECEFNGAGISKLVRVDRNGDDNRITTHLRVSMPDSAKAYLKDNPLGVCDSFRILSVPDGKKLKSIFENNDSGVSFENTWVEKLIESAVFSAWALCGGETP